MTGIAMKKFAPSSEVCFQRRYGRFDQGMRNDRGFLKMGAFIPVYTGITF